MKKEESKADLYQGQDGRFKKGNPGGSGGERVGAGRPPKPEESLLRKLYGILEKSSEQAIKILQKQLQSSDSKVAQGAAKIILGKILPERSAHESWKIKDVVTPEEHSDIAKLLAWKREKDLKEARENEEKEPMEDEEKRLKLVRGEGS